MRKRLLLILIPLLAAIVAAFVTLTGDKQYKSNTQLATGFTAVRNIGFGENTAGINPFEVEAKFSNLQELLKSKLIISLLSYRLLLNDLEQKGAFREFKNDGKKHTFKKDDFKKAREIAEQKLKIKEPLSTSVPEEEMVMEILKAFEYDYATLQKEISIYRQGQSDYVNVEYLSENPSLSAFVVNTLADEFIKYNDQSNTTQSDTLIAFLENRVKEKKKIRDDKTALLRDITNKTGGVAGDGASEGIQGRIGSLEKELQDARQKAQTAQLQLQSINRQLASLSSGGGRVLSQSEINREIARLKDRQREFTRTGPADSVTSITAQITRLLTLSDAGSSSNVAPAVRQADLEAKRDQYTVDYQVAQSSIASISSNLASLNGMLNNSKDGSAITESLKKEVTAANEAMIDAESRLSEAEGSTKTASLGSIKIAIKGQPADEPESKKTAITTIFAFVISLALCVFGIIFGEYLDTSIKIPSIFQRQTDIKLIGMLNDLQPSGLNAKEIVKIEDIFTEEPDEDIQETTFRELIRKLRFEVENSGGKTFLFTSTKQQEGKTTVLWALACSLSTNKKKILIVDTNFMNNSLTQLLNANPSLENSMINDLDHEYIVTKQENIVSKIKHIPHIQNVDIIGCEGGNYSPSEVFPERKFSGQIITLASKYDYIFLEGGALNLYSDSKELANYVDKVIAVFSAKSVIRPADKESIAYLKSLKNKFVGAVLNRVDIDNLEL
jgi:uncharacterized protein involved in exopolysaccharide biosynthesis/Mrp family chromosome partitioning ATPase